MLLLVNISLVAFLVGMWIRIDVDSTGRALLLDVYVSGSRLSLTDGWADLLPSQSIALSTHQEGPTEPDRSGKPC